MRTRSFVHYKIKGELFAMEQLEKMRGLRFVDAYIEDNKMWAMNMNFSALFKIDLDSFIIEYVSCIYDKDNVKQNYYARNIFGKDNKLWLFPFKGNSVVEYDKSSNTMELSNYSSTKTADYREIVNQWTIIHKQQAWMFPRDLDSLTMPLLIYDMEKKKYIEHTNWGRKILEFGIDGQGCRITSLCQVGDWVWGVISGVPGLFAYDLEQSQMQFYNIGAGIELQAVSHDGNNFWVLTKNKSILLEWNKKLGIIKQFDLSQDKEGFSNIALAQDRVIALPRFGSDIVILNRKDNELIRISSFPKTFQRLRGLEKSSLMYGWKVYNNKLLLFPWGGNMLLELDLKTFGIMGHSMELSESLFHESYTFSDICQGKIIESSKINLENYLSFIKTYKGSNKKNIKEQVETIGKMISYTVIKN